MQDRSESPTGMEVKFKEGVQGKNVEPGQGKGFVAPDPIRDRMLDGVGEVEVFLTAEDIAKNPQILYGKSKEDISNILGDEWKEGTYGSKKTGWKFIKDDKSVFYHTGGGLHKGSYYGYSSGTTGKVKIVGDDYIPTPDDKATIIHVKQEERL